MSGGEAVLGVDVGGTKVWMGALDLGDGTLRARALPTRELVPDGLVPAICRAVGDFARDLRREAGVRLLQAGLVAPGNPDPGAPQFAPNNPGWSLPQGAAGIADALGLAQVAVDNDVNAAALAEYEIGEHAGAPVLLHLNIGTGFAGGLVVDGRTFRGAHGLAMELGYGLTRHQRATRGAASGVAPVEQYVSGQGLADLTLAMGRPGMRASDVLAAHPEDGELWELQEVVLGELVDATISVAIAVDPSVITLGGGVAPALVPHLDRVRAGLAEFVPHPPVLALSRRPREGAMLGALCLALRALDLPIPARLADAPVEPAPSAL